MTEPYLLPISSATSTNHADANGTPSGYSHGIFRQPNRPYLSAGYRNDMSPTPHLHSHPQQLSRMVPYPPSHPQLHNISYGPPQPMRNATYTQMPALANASHRHTNVHPTSLDVQRYQRHPGSTPPAGTYLHQSGVAFPPSQRPEPQHLPPCGSSTQPYPLPQGHVLPHNHPAPLPQYPAAPSRQIHGVLMPHQPYPQVTQVRGHQRVPPPHYTSAPLQYNIQQDQNDPPYVPPRAPESVQSDRKNKRKVSDSKEPVPRNSKIQKVPPPQSPILFKKRRGPGVRYFYLRLLTIL
ncbi:hypothetical protein DFS33DRAFT_360095 [Desarmillaria ectypa]|nr:hypothetical protein DFS33DRAFT_360095 [Desarmillaria ectypa]